MMCSALISILPEVILFCSAIFMVLLACLPSKPHRFGFFIALVSVLCAISSVFYLDKMHITNVFVDSIYDSSYHAKNLLKICILSILVLILGSFYGVYSLSSKELNSPSKVRNFTLEYLFLILLSCFGVFISVASTDIITLFVGLELSSFCAYIICTIDRKNQMASEAAVKYFIIGCAMSCMSLLGMSFIYGIFNEIKYENFSSDKLSNSYYALLPFVLLLSNMLFKFGLFPNHFVNLDVYHGSPSYVGNFLGTVNKFSAFVGIVIINSISRKIGMSDEINFVVNIICCVSLIFGAIGGIGQLSIKRLLGYSSIINGSFIVFATFNSDSYIDEFVLVYVLIYSANVIGIFTLLNIFYYDKEDIKIEDLSGIYKTNPHMSFCLLVFVFSLMGIPPFAGFFAKYYVIKQSLSLGNFVFAFCAIFASVVSGYYYLKMIKVAFFQDRASSANVDVRKSKALSLVCFFCVLVSIFGFML